MEIGLEGLKILANRGTGLRLTVEPDGIHRVKVTSHTGESFSSPAAWSGNLESDVQELAARLRYYPYFPQPVWINGQQIEREPWENLCVIETTKYLSTDGQSYSVSYRSPSGQPGCRLGPYNALVGGTLTHIYTSPLTERVVEFHGPAPSGGNSYWTPANRIRLQPAIVILTSELDQLSDLKELQKLPPAIAERRASQIRNTLAHPDMPKVHPGTVYRYVTGKQDQAFEYETSGMPIIVQGQPVDLEQYKSSNSNADFVSAAEALYREDQPLVPVRRDPRNSEPIPAVTGWGFTVYEHSGNPRPPVSKCRRITGLFTLNTPEGQREITVPAAFHMTKDYETHVVRFTDEVTSSQELAEVMVRGFAEAEDCNNWQDHREQLEFLTQQYQTEVEAAMGQPSEAAAGWLQLESERIDREFPFEWESGTATATSQSGRITITIHQEG